MGKCGPKPKIERPKRGRKKGTIYSQTKTISAKNDVAFGEKPEHYFDSLSTYEIALEYVKKYDVKPLRAARLAVCIQYANYAYAQHAFSSIEIRDPYSNKILTPSLAEQKEFNQNFDDNFSLAPTARMNKIIPRHISNYDIARELPNPREITVWIDKTHPLARRVAARIYRHNKDKSVG